MSNIVIRDPKPEDVAFIYSTWLKGQYHGSEFFKASSRQSYFKHYAAFVESVLINPNTKINVACLEDDIDIIISYCVYTTSGALYWVYTKDGWRGQGWAKKTVPQGISSVKSLTKAGAAIARKKGWKFDPWGD